jgi:hypothetical protein
LAAFALAPFGSETAPTDRVSGAACIQIMRDVSERVAEKVIGANFAGTFTEIWRS